MYVYNIPEQAYDMFVGIVDKNQLIGQFYGKNSK